MNDAPDWADDKGFGADLDLMSRDAVMWFSLMHADAVSNADKAAFRAWIRRDERHALAYAEIERLWSGMGKLPTVQQQRRTARAQMTRRAFGGAVLTLAAGGGAWGVYRQFPFADYRTGTGERRTVALPDGSSAELSAATALSLDFRPERRLVSLHKGEAFFSVAPGQSRPFMVEAGGGRTVAAGTSFNVAYVPEGVAVTVAEHAVDVRTGSSDIRLQAGFQATYENGRIGSAESIDPAIELAWREGRLVFVSTPLGRVVASLNRWRGGRLVLMSPALASRPVTLIVDIDKAGDIVPTLQDALPIRTVSITPYVTLIFAA